MTVSLLDHARARISKWIGKRTSQKTPVGTRAAIFALLAAAACSDNGPYYPTEVPPPPVAPPQAVALLINPIANTLDVGSTVQLTVTVQDASGNPMTGEVVSWATSNANIASVNETGLVTGIGAGDVLISAHAAGLSAQVQLNVQAKAPPPGPPGVPSGTPVFQDLFESGDYVSNYPGGAWSGGGSGNVHVCAGGAGGSAYSLCLIHRGKASNQMSSAEQRFKLFKGAPEVWIEYDFLVPTNFYHRLSDVNSENNKFLALWEDNYTGVAQDKVTPTPLLVFEFRPMKTGEAGSSYLYLHGTDRTGKIRPSLGNKWQSAFGSWNRGKWIQIRVHVKLASSDTVSDGLVELYADGTRQISAIDLPLHSAAAGRVIRQGYIMGWSNSGYDADTEFKVDNFRMYSSNPGWW